MFHFSWRLMVAFCRRAWKLRVVRLISAIVLIVLGIIGWLLPIVPGWPLLIPGLIIMGEFFPPLERAVHWAQKKLHEERERRKAKAAKPK